MIRLLIIDDSFFVRQVVKKMVSDDPEIEVIGEACDGKEGIAKIRELKPDVITLDLVMPVQDGIMTIEEVIAESLTPCVIFSSLSSPMTEISKSLYDMGLFHLLKKPTDPEQFSAVRKELISNIKSAAKTDLTKLNKNYRSAVSSGGDGSGHLGKLLIIACPGPKLSYPEEFISCISTVKCPIIVQHFLQAQIAEAWIRVLKKISHVSVKFAEDGDLLIPSRMLVSPSAKALEVARFEHNGAIQLIDVDKSSKPRLDTLFISAAHAYREKTVLVVFPGLGQNDGIEGIKTMRQMGCKVFIHNEQLIVSKIIDNTLANKILPTEKLAEEVLAFVN